LTRPSSPHDRENVGPSTNPARAVDHCAAESEALARESRRLWCRVAYVAGHRSGSVNTRFGWDPAEFDSVLLDAALTAGLGVAIPYDIDFEADARDPNVRAQAREELQSQIQQFASHPATRMWAIGNEVLQRIVQPDWCGADVPAEMGERAQSHAGLILKLADLAHQLDPSHPVIYRESEDSYTSWFGRALRGAPANRPWLIYGINAYTSRLGEILDAWPQKEIPCAVLVSEFGQAQAVRGQRGQTIRETWETIRARGEYVLGGAAYVWYSDGPEPGDINHGLVDIAGEPVDDALAALADVFHADAASA
jgi:hypothetical protein